MCSVFWLFWLSCQYLPTDWLERDSSEKSNHGDEIVRLYKASPKSVYDFVGLVYCFIVLLCVCLVPAFIRFDIDSTAVRQVFDCLSKVIKVTVT